MSGPGGKLALMFPGQGVQQVGMGRDLAERFAVADRTFREAGEVLGVDVAEACFHGPAARLLAADICQPAILTASIAAFRVAEEHGLRADVVMGHSLGEYAALVAAGAISFPDALAVVAQRAALTGSVAAGTPGRMAAVLGAPSNVVRALCAEAGDVWLANDNCPGQVVASGHREGIDRLIEIARRRGIHVRLLEIDGAFHSKIMTPAVSGLRAALAAVPVRAPSIPFLSATTAAFEPVERLRGLLTRQITAPVRFRQAVRTALRLGVDQFVELGPRRVLCGLVARVSKAATTIHVGAPADLVRLDALRTLGGATS